MHMTVRGAVRQRLPGSKHTVPLFLACKIKQCPRGTKSTCTRAILDRLHTVQILVHTVKWHRLILCPERTRERIQTKAHAPSAGNETLNFELSKVQPKRSLPIYLLHSM
jgi:hypothetical protein